MLLIFKKWDRFFGRSDYDGYIEFEYDAEKIYTTNCK